MLEQLRREQEEELEKVQRHLEAVELAARELEDSMRALQQASAATESVALTEVSSQLGQEVEIKSLSEIGRPSDHEYVDHI